jgi:hypothetical protein
VKNSPLVAGLAMLLCPGPIEAPLQSIAERDLLLYIRSRVLRRLTIVQTGSGLYRLVVSLTVERNNFVLASARGSPREWSSLDSLAKQIRCKYGSPATVALSLTYASSLSIERCDGDSGSVSNAPVATRPVRSRRSRELTQ